jgi:hypothetical protein
MLEESLVNKENNDVKNNDDGGDGDDDGGDGDDDLSLDSNLNELELMLSKGRGANILEVGYYFNQVVLVIIQQLGYSHVVNKTVLGSLSIVFQLLFGMVWTFYAFKAELDSNGMVAVISQDTSLCYW